MRLELMPVKRLGGIAVVGIDEIEVTEADQFVFVVAGDAHRRRIDVREAAAMIGLIDDVVRVLDDVAVALAKESVVAHAEASRSQVPVIATSATRTQLRPECLAA